MKKEEPETLLEQLRIWLLKILIGKEGVNIIRAEKAAADIATARAGYAKFAASEQKLTPAQARQILASSELAAGLGGLEQLAQRRPFCLGGATQLLGKLHGFFSSEA